MSRVNPSAADLLICSSVLGFWSRAQTLAGHLPSLLGLHSLPDVTAHFSVLSLAIRCQRSAFSQRRSAKLKRFEGGVGIRPNGLHRLIPDT